MVSAITGREEARIASSACYPGLRLFKFNREIVFGVVITDVLHHASQESHVIRRFACFDPFAEEGAEEAAEVVVARIGEEAP